MAPTVARTAEELALIDEFIRSYEREVDFYASAVRLARDFIEGALIEAGVRAIVTGRAKRPDSLRKKMVGRARMYATDHDIRDDIVDLAGVRVALYFPAQRHEVGAIVRRIFQEQTTIEFPKPDAHRVGRAFPGYVATHHRVHMRDDSLSLEQKRYGTARIEIQVASVLMHAWAEVEHDLAYKPSSGDLSIDERGILDQLNGLVVSGEQSLEVLQRAFERRVTERNRTFFDQYDLAAVLSRHLSGKLGGGEMAMGRSDLLLSFLRALKMDTPSAVAPLVQQVDGYASQPIADRLIDLIIGHDLERLAVFESIRHDSDDPASNLPTQDARDRFLRLYFELDALESGGAPPLTASLRARLEALRNLALHGRSFAAPDMFARAIADMEAIGLGGRQTQ